MSKNPLADLVLLITAKYRRLPLSTVTRLAFMCDWVTTVYVDESVTKTKWEINPTGPSNDNLNDAIGLLGNDVRLETIGDGRDAIVYLVARHRFRLKAPFIQKYLNDPFYQYQRYFIERVFKEYDLLGPQKFYTWVITSLPCYCNAVTKFTDLSAEGRNFREVRKVAKLAQKDKRSILNIQMPSTKRGGALRLPI